MIWRLITSVFTKSRVSKVWRIIFDGAVTLAIYALTNKEIMDAAFEISLSILGLKATGEEKAAEFDARMHGWCSEHGIDPPSRAEMNSIREVAYAAVRAKIERGIVRRMVRD